MIDDTSKPLRIGYLPSTAGQFENHIFESTPNDDGRLRPFSSLREALEQHGHTLETADDLQSKYDALFIHRIDVNAGKLLELIRTYPNTRLIYLVTEEETVCPLHDPAVIDALNFDATMSWNPAAVARGAVSYAYPNPTLSYDAGEEFESRRLLVAIAANKKARPFARGDLYTYRHNVFHALARDDRFGLYGPGWAQEVMGTIYKGMAENKSAVLRKYRFNLVIENSRELGGVTEKLFDCMANGCVPVYFGAPDIADWVPKECFIDLEQIGVRDLCAKLACVTKAEWQAHRNAIEAFLMSPRYTRFAEKGFVDAARKALDLAMMRSPPRNHRAMLRLLAGAAIRKPSIWFYRGGQKFIVDLALAATPGRLRQRK